MNIKAILIIFTTIIAAVTITGCNSKDEKHLLEVLKKEAPVAIAFMNKDGKFIVVDAISGDIVPPKCPKSSPNDTPRCTNLFSIPPHNISDTRYSASKTPSPNSRTSGGIILSTNDKLKINHQIVVEIIDWTGSYCRTYINRTSGEEYTRCHGNE